MATHHCTTHFNIPFNTNVPQLQQLHKGLTTIILYRLHSLPPNPTINKTMSAMSPAPHNFRATEKYLRVCTTGCLVCTCTSIFVWKILPGNGGQSGLARVENSPCNSESLATCSTRESSPVFRNYRNTMTDHISHFFPCWVNLGSSLFSNCLWEDKG